MQSNKSIAKRTCLRQAGKEVKGKKKGKRRLPTDLSLPAGRYTRIKMQHGWSQIFLIKKMLPFLRASKS